MNGSNPQALDPGEPWHTEVERPRRLDALQSLDLLDSPVEHSFDRLTRLASKLLGVPVVLVSLVDDRRQFFKSSYGLPEPWNSLRETPLSHSFCKHVVSQKSPLIIEDARLDPTVHENLAIRDLNVIAYLGFPLTTPSGEVLGSFCAIDSVPRAWTEREKDILREITACVNTEIELREDVIRLRNLEVELREARNAAEEASRAKGEFLAQMSHEVRTPLAAMIGFTEMLLDPNLPEEDRWSALRALRRNGLHLQEIVDDILDLSKIEAGKIELEKIPSDPVKLLNDVVDTLRSKATAAGSTIEVSCSGNLPGKVELDATKIRQVLFNLGGNAVKFAKKGPIRFSLDHEQCDNGEIRLSFEVQDSGIGMTPEQLGRLFTPFHQADSSMHRKYGGTGLGLSISKKLALAMGGDLVAESRLGHGSRFAFHVPVSLVSNPVPKPPASSAPEGPPQVVAGLAGRILLADDSEDIRRAMAHRLRNLGLTVEFAHDGATAVTQAILSRYDLILMDMQMPGIDGISAVRLLKEAGYEGPIVALTANAFEEHRRRCLDAGCVEHLTKPVKLDEMLRVLKTYCRSYIEFASAGRPCD